MTAIANTQQNVFLPAAPPSAWRCLLWKDYRHSLSTMLACFGVLLGLQVLIASQELLFPSNSVRTFQSLFALAMLAPTFSGLAAAGVLFGQERQLGTLAWQSSLPVTWNASLISKSIVWFGWSCVLFAALALTSMAITRLLGYPGVPEWTDGSDGALLVGLAMLGMAINVFVIMSTATLLWKEPLLALVMGTLFILLVQCFLIPVSIHYGLWLCNVAPARGSVEFTSALWTCSIAATFLAVLLAFPTTYRWRWGSGQLTNLSLAKPNVGSPRSQFVSWALVAEGYAKPPQWWVLLSHSLRTSRGLRLAVIAMGIVLPSFLPSTRETGPAGELVTLLVVVVVVCISCLLGVSTFSGEQSLGRYRFYSDRGVSWTTFWTTQAILPLIATLLLGISIDIRFPPFPAYSTLSYYRFTILSLAVFPLGMLCILILPSAIMAFFSSALSFVSIAMIVLAIGRLLFDFAPESVLPFWFLIPSWIVILLASNLLGPRWLKELRPKTRLVGFSCIALAAFIPVILTLCLGHLAIPAVPWQGQQINGLRPFSISNEAVPSFQEDDLANYFSLVSKTELPYSYQNVTYVPKIGTTIEDREKLQSKLLTLREELKSSLDATNSQSFSSAHEYVRALSQAIRNTAQLGTLAVLVEDRETAELAWSTNKRLLRISNNPELLPSTLPYQTETWSYWKTCIQQATKLFSEDQIREWLPEDLGDPDTVRQALKIRATTVRFLVENDSAMMTADQIKYSANGDLTRLLDLYSDRNQVIYDQDLLRWRTFQATLGKSRIATPVARELILRSNALRLAQNLGFVTGLQNQILPPSRSIRGHWFNGDPFMLNYFSYLTNRREALAEINGTDSSVENAAAEPVSTQPQLVL